MNKKRVLHCFIFVFVFFSLTLPGYAGQNPTETVYFDPFAATPSIDSMNALETIKQKLSENPELQILIEGHADAGEVRPEEKDAVSYLKSLSRMRADFVSNWLKSALGNTALISQVASYGTERQGDKSLLKDQHASNRRVDLTIYTKDAPPEGLSSGDSPKVLVPEMVHEFEGVLENTKVTYDYLIKNTGTATLDILSVKPG
ncbi:MAG: OmpA family protein [Proteobacteria bacterium]|nr:OmpA family protein [Pseudomonadota bacterium]